MRDVVFFFFQAEDGIRDGRVTGVQTCALPISGAREPDSQYRQMLERIVASGAAVPTRQGPAALTLMQQTMRFDLPNGFPVITERSVKSFWRKPIGELCAFINGATTLDELADL